MKTHFLILFSLTAYLLSGCSQSDYDSDSGLIKTPLRSGESMSIGVSLPSNTTRVTETADATKGLITAWENTDVLQVFHKYTNNGAAGTMQSFNFTSTGAGSNSTFTYSGAGGYSFASSNSLYAFNALPTANIYTQTYNFSDNNFTLSLSDYDLQDGTVTNLNNYDAMYGVSSVDGDGTPEAMGMNHLMSVLRFDLTNAAFTDPLTSVTFTYTATSGSSLLPASGDFTLSNTGTVSTGTLTGVTSWTVSNVAASSGTAPIYLITFPDQRSGKLTITATDSDGNAYYREITLSDLSLTSGSMKAYKITLNSIATYSFKYYMWDATAEYVSGVTNYNTITPGVATNSCKDCPTYDQIQMYLGAGAYWDSTTPWKNASSGITYIGGIWLRKKAYISGFDEGTATKATSISIPLVGVPTNINEYFFLPACGYNNGGTNYVGRYGYYWSSTASAFANNAYYLVFYKNLVSVTNNYRRYYGFCVWPVQ